MQRKTFCACYRNFQRYFISQAASGFSDIVVFRGALYQRGFGIVSLVKRFGIPVLKFLGKHLLKTGVDVGQDLFAKRNYKEAFKERAKAGAKAAASESVGKLSQFIDQSGTGQIRKRKARSKKLYKMKKKSIKQK